MSTQVIQTQQAVIESGYLIPLNQTGTQPITLSNHLSIGRDTQNDLEIADPFASSRHAKIEKTANGILLHDLQSRNGTFVNGVKIKEAYLNEGDHIKIGEREFLFTLFAEKLDQPSIYNFSSKNPKWGTTLQSIPIFARTNLPVFLMGESGSGKEVIAKKIHENSSRCNGPFVSLNCSAFNESLAESELFGHVKGSFTDARQTRKGAFEAARGGTLFLDEIGDLPLNIQPKLLRALENKEIRPLGSDQNIPTDVRIIAATHKNIRKKVTEGSFRSDLYYRLHVIQVLIPPLRDRVEDFEDILYSFAREMKARFSLPAIEEMKKHLWPGNIRELKNVVARASALYPGQTIQPELLKTLIDSPIAEPIEFGKRTSLPLHKELEKKLIMQKLIEHHGNQRKTAMDLGMPKSTLHDRIKVYQIDLDNLFET